MSFLSRKRTGDRTEDARQLVISYKKFFSSHEGKEVFSDLANHFRLLDDPIEGKNSDRHIGEQSVLKYILKKANINLDQFEQILKGEFNG